jgi:hypothetical protein
MVTYVSIVAGAFLKLLEVAAGALYLGMVAMRYRMDGPNYALRLELRDPARSAEELVVWLGVKALGLGIKLLKAIFNMLLEASAEVGEWIMRRSPAAQKAIRSRFLV